MELGSQAPFPDYNVDLIGSATSIEEIINALASRGCPNLTSAINLDACSDFPFAGGGFCDVYRGALHDGTKIAIKSLRVYDRPEAKGDGDKAKLLKRAARELYFWSRLKHHNVLPLMGLTIFRGYLSMVSPWMENGSLPSYLRSNPKPNRIELCMDISEGLRYIHANGMFHGDLKAANIMVTSNGTAMIADFGNAQLRDLTLKFTNTTTNALSVRWAAPELLLADRGPQMSKEADIYAYGMTVLETLTGEIPYEGISDNRVICLVAYEQKVPSRPDIDISDDLWDLLNSCWTREPSKRPEIGRVSDCLKSLVLPASSARFLGDRYEGDIRTNSNKAPVPPVPPQPSQDQTHTASNYLYKARALYEYIANPDDSRQISLARGEVLDVVDDKRDWPWCHIRKTNGAIGIAPSHFLQRLDVGNDHEAAGYACKVQALYAYTASPDDPAEISFSKGEILDIMDSTGKWWQARKADGTTGIVPSNYFRFLSEGKATSNDRNYPPGVGNDPKAANYACKARALYAYTASPDDPAEISLSKGEILDIVDNNGRWWQARKADGTTGIIPSNYLQLV